MLIGPRTNHKLSSSVKGTNAVWGSSPTSTSASAERHRSCEASRSDVSFEGAQLLIPMRLELIEPGLETDHGLGPQLKDTSPGIASRTLVHDQSSPQ